MKDSETKQQFTALRAKGKSYEKIARELGVSKPTLLKWGKEYKEEIDNFKAIELEALKEEYLLTTEAMVEFYGSERQRIVEELKKRDLSAVPTPKLYDTLAKCEAQIKAVCPDLPINDDDTLATQKMLRQLVSSRGNGNGTSAASSAVRGGGTGALRAEDLVRLERNALQRFQAGETNARDVRTQFYAIKTLLKGTELADLQKRLERIEEFIRQSN